VPGAADGVRYNDPAFDVKWPLPVTTIAEKDMGWSDFKA
jgi:dTDP-4-dehydrorhamnose 3,5-epimerase